METKENQMWDLLKLAQLTHINPNRQKGFATLRTALNELYTCKYKLSRLQTMLWLIQQRPN